MSITKGLIMLSGSFDTSFNGEVDFSMLTDHKQATRINNSWRSRGNSVSKQHVKSTEDPRPISQRTTSFGSEKEPLTASIFSISDIEERGLNEEIFDRIELFLDEVGMFVVEPTQPLARKHINTKLLLKQSLSINSTGTEDSELASPDSSSLMLRRKINSLNCSPITKKLGLEMRKTKTNVLSLVLKSTNFSDWSQNLTMEEGDN